ncbi:MAG: tetratricopeptide repeat protein [Thermoflexibacter sp.]|nr:tetratricopeptide repeat protein [Thermoflexibacter sp.]
MKKITHIFFFIAIFFYLDVYGQNSTDSLFNLLSQLPKDSSFVNLSYQIADRLDESNPDKALEVAQSALKLAKEIKYQQGHANLLVSMGWIYYRQGNIDKAFAISQEALALLEQIGSNQSKAEVLSNIAAIYNEQKNYTLSLNYFEKALAIQTAMNNKAGIVRCFNNLAYTSLKLQRYDISKEYVQKSIEANKEVGNQYYLGFALRTKGDIEYAQKNNREAIDSWKQALVIAKSIGNKSFTVTCLNRIGKVHFEQNEFVEAQGYLYESMNIAEKFGFRSELRDVYQLSAANAEALQKPYLALTLHKKFFALHDSLFNESTTKRLSQLEMIFDSKQKAQEIELLKAKNKEDKLIILSTLGTLFALIIISILILKNRNKIQKAFAELGKASKEIQEKNEEILQQKEEIEQTNETLKEINQKLEEQSSELKTLNITKDKLFAIIGHDLRSPIGALIGLMNLLDYGDISQAEFVGYSHKLKASVESLYLTLHNLLIWANNQMQGIKINAQVFNLHEVGQENVELLTEIAKSKKIDLSNKISPAMKVNADIDHVKLVFRNLISNALKYTLPSGEITLDALVKDKFVEIVIRDTGVGMSEAILSKLFTSSMSSTKGTGDEKGTGLGLLLCKDFIEKNGGKIWAESQENKGSSFYFTLPIANN